MASYSHPKNFLSNMEKKDKTAILKAAQVTRIKIYIQDKAFDFNGHRLTDCVSVFSSDDKQNCSPLWAKFNEFKKGNRV